MEEIVIGNSSRLKEGVLLYFYTLEIEHSINKIKNSHPSDSIFGKGKDSIRELKSATCFIIEQLRYIENRCLDLRNAQETGSRNKSEHDPTIMGIYIRIMNALKSITLCIGEIKTKGHKGKHSILLDTLCNSIVGNFEKFRVDADGLGGATVTQGTVISDSMDPQKIVVMWSPPVKELDYQKTFDYSGL